MKILLILPFNTYEGKYNNETILKKGGDAELPLGLAYIKSYVKSKLPEIEIEIYDSNIDAIQYITFCDNKANMDILWRRVEKKIEDFDPDIVGISAFSHAVVGQAHKAIALCKDVNKDIITVMGGSYPTLDSECAMEDVNLDIVVLSEGEIVFYNLVKAFIHNIPLSHVKGIVYRDKGKTIVNPMEEKIQNLDELPFPDLEDLPVHLYGELARNSYQKIMDNQKPISIVSSRGCIFQCGFCATKKVWSTIRYRSAENVLEEIRYLKKKYNINFIKINDDLFTHNSERVIDICDYLIKERPIKYWGSTGENVKSLTNQNMVKKMVESGYRLFSLAIESGCNNTLKRIKKPLTLNMVQDAIDNLRQHEEVYIGASFIVGFPFETKEDIQQTYDFASSLEVNWVSLNIFSPFPKTDLYDYCIKEGYINNKKITYKDLQSTSILTTPSFDKDWLRDCNYYNNLKINFIENYALKQHNYKLAIKDFNNVITMVPNHAFGLLFLGYSFDNLGNTEQATHYYNEAKNIFKSNYFWGNYLNLFERDIKEKINFSLC